MEEETGDKPEPCFYRKQKYRCSRKHFGGGGRREERQSPQSPPCARFRVCVQIDGQCCKKTSGWCGRMTTERIDFSLQVIRQWKKKLCLSSFGCLSWTPTAARSACSAAARTLTNCAISHPISWITQLLIRSSSKQSLVAGPGIYTRAVRWYWDESSGRWRPWWKKVSEYVSVWPWELRLRVSISVNTSETEAPAQEHFPTAVLYIHA